MCKGAKHTVSRWSLDEQIQKTDEKIRYLQARKKELQAKKIEVLKEKEQEELRELYSVLRGKGVEPEQYSELISRLNTGE